MQKPKCDKTIISFGDDEYILDKDNYISRCWSECDGDHTLIPNSDEIGLMVSSIQSR